MKKIIERLLKKLICDDNVNHLNVYKSDENNWRYYYHISLEYKGERFTIWIRKGASCESIFEIIGENQSGSFQDYLKTITELQFKIK
jgi:hypothetical protein